MEDLLKQVATLLADRAPGVYASLNPPATWAEIAEAQYKSDLTFNDDLVSLFRWCNGQRDDDSARTSLLSTGFPGAGLGSLDWLVQIAGFHREMLDADDGADTDESWWSDTSDRHAGGTHRLVGWHRGLLPFGRGNSGALRDAWVLDLLPRPAGTVGQVLQNAMESDGHRLLAPSLRALFLRMSAVLRENAEVWDEEAGWRVGDDGAPWFMAGADAPSEVSMAERALPRKSDIGQLLDAVLPSLREHLRVRPPADAREHLGQALTSMHAVLPDEVAHAYGQHDGQAPDASAPLLLGRYRWLPALEMARAWRALQRRARTEPSLQAHAGFDDPVWRESDVRPCAHSANWLPIGEDAQGRWLMLDLMPGPRGVRGQLIEACDDAVLPRHRWYRVVAGGFDEAVAAGLASLREAPLPEASGLTAPRLSPELAAWEADLLHWVGQIEAGRQGEESEPRRRLLEAIRAGMALHAAVAPHSSAADDVLLVARLASRWAEADEFGTAHELAVDFHVNDQHARFLRIVDLARAAAAARAALRDLWLPRMLAQWIASEPEEFDADTLAWIDAQMASVPPHLRGPMQAVVVHTVAQHEADTPSPLAHHRGRPAHEIVWEIATTERDAMVLDTALIAYRHLMASVLAQADAGAPLVQAMAALLEGRTDDCLLHHRVDLAFVQARWAAEAGREEEAIRQFTQAWELGRHSAVMSVLETACVAAVQVAMRLHAASDEERACELLAAALTAYGRPLTPAAALSVFVAIVELLLIPATSAVPGSAALLAVAQARRWAREFSFNGPASLKGAVACIDELLRQTQEPQRATDLSHRARQWMRGNLHALTTGAPQGQIMSELWRQAVDSSHPCCDDAQFCRLVAHFQGVDARAMEASAPGLAVELLSQIASEPHRHIEPSRLQRVIDGLHLQRLPGLLDDIERTFANLSAPGVESVWLAVALLRPFDFLHAALGRDLRSHPAGLNGPDFRAGEERLRSLGAQAELGLLDAWKAWWTPLASVRSSQELLQKLEGQQDRLEGLLDRSPMAVTGAWVNALAWAACHCHAEGDTAGAASLRDLAASLMRHQPAADWAEMQAFLLWTRRPPGQPQAHRDEILALLAARPSELAIQWRQRLGMMRRP